MNKDLLVQDINNNCAEKLSLLFNALPDCIAQFDTGLNLVFANSAYYQNIQKILRALFRETPGTIKDEPVDVLWKNELKKVRDSGELSEFSIALKGQQKKCFYNIKIKPEFDHAKKIRFILVICCDLTELKNNEELLLEAERIGETGNYELDLIQNKIKFSDQMYRILGYEPNAFEPTLEMFNAFSKQEEALSATKKITAPEDFLHRFETVQKVYRADGEKLHIASNGTVFYNEEGTAVKVSGNAKDVTLQVKAYRNKERADKEIGQNLYFIETLTKATPGVISITDLDTQLVVYMNRNVYTLLGYTHEEFEKINNQWELLHPGDMHILEQFKADILKASDDEIIELEWRLKANDESWQWIHSNNKVFKRNEEGKPKQYISVSHFITTKKKAEEDLNELRTQQQNEILNAIITAQEEERSRIAEALHNDLGQLLYITQMKLDSDKREAAILLNQAINKTRSISFELMPSILQDYGLDTALKDLVKQFSQLGLKIAYTNTEAFKRINKDLEITIFRIIQELTNNIIKHSKAKSAALTITYVDDVITIHLADNGIGFDTNKLKLKKKGFGLRNIKNRLNIYNGTLKINSQAGTGTNISISIPCC